FIHGFLLDISREKELELDLARQRAALDAFFRESSIGLGITDADGRFIKLNDALARINDTPAEEHLGRTLAEIAPEAAAVADPLREASDASFPERSDIQVPGENGPRDLLVSYFPVALGDERYH